ncbi:MAG: hypothetical protein H6Q97_211 [Nitrospirae bacterium]|nr:hypothetical protein [Nitrospirota bacterium]
MPTFLAAFLKSRPPTRTFRKTSRSSATVLPVFRSKAWTSRSLWLISVTSSRTFMTSRSVWRQWMLSASSLSKRAYRAVCALSRMLFRFASPRRVLAALFMSVFRSRLCLSISLMSLSTRAWSSSSFCIWRSSKSSSPACTISWMLILPLRSRSPRSRTSCMENGRL